MLRFERHDRVGHSVGEVGRYEEAYTGRLDHLLSGRGCSCEFDLHRHATTQTARRSETDAPRGGVYTGQLERPQQHLCCLFGDLDFDGGVLSKGIYRSSILRKRWKWPAGLVL